MFVNQLLPSFTIDHDRKIIKRLYMTAYLKSVRQIYRNGNAFLAQLVKKMILNIDGFVQINLPPWL